MHREEERKTEGGAVWEGGRGEKQETEENVYREEERKTEEDIYREEE